MDSVSFVAFGKVCVGQRSGLDLWPYGDSPGPRKKKKRLVSWRAATNRLILNLRLEAHWKVATAPVVLQDKAGAPVLDATDDLQAPVLRTMRHSLPEDADEDH
jgi:hypothetical protein